ncbi:MAG: hypothetical protein ACI9JN_002848 [Bacteroidia bacterium]|jgi:hypothetical protein
MSLLITFLANLNNSLDATEHVAHNLQDQEKPYLIDLVSSFFSKDKK